MLLYPGLYLILTQVGVLTDWLLQNDFSSLPAAEAGGELLFFLPVT